MAHPKWCGKDCAECTNPCELDTSIPCSPNCEGLDNKTGLPSKHFCNSCDAINKKCYKSK